MVREPSDLVLNLRAHAVQELPIPRVQAARLPPNVSLVASKECKPRSISNIRDIARKDAIQQTFGDIVAPDLSAIDTSWELTNLPSSQIMIPSSSATS